MVYVSIQRDTQCSPQSAATLERSRTHFSHHHAWRHWDRSHYHADPSSQVHRKHYNILVIYVVIINAYARFSTHSRFDVGPVLSQELHQVPENCTADELGDALATKGARLVSCESMPCKIRLVECFIVTWQLCFCSGLQLLNTLATLPERLAQRREQRQTGATFGK